MWLTTMYYMIKNLLRQQILCEMVLSQKRGRKKTFQGDGYVYRIVCDNSSMGLYLFGDYVWG